MAYCVVANGKPRKLCDKKYNAHWDVWEYFTEESGVSCEVWVGTYSSVKIEQVELNYYIEFYKRGVSDWRANCRKSAKELGLDLNHSYYWAYERGLDDAKDEHKPTFKGFTF